MKKIFLAVAITAICTGAYAQSESDKKFHFSVGPEVGFATGDFNVTHSVGVGATVQAEYNVGGTSNVTLTTGYMSYAGKSAGAGIKFKAAGIIPLKVGLKYFLSEGFYGAAQIGAGFFNNGGGTAFAYTPMIGYEFNAKSGQAIDAGLKYDGYSKNGSGLGSVGVRIAYKF
ncbi:hypothetical protein [Ferruginibacter sp.]|nr:hypothetical protein [Ferruginibacter sp.]